MLTPNPDNAKFLYIRQQLFAINRFYIIILLAVYV